MRLWALVIVLALFVAACAGSKRGVAAQCDPCTQTSDCQEGLFCGPAGQCTTMACDQVGCSDAVGWVVSCMGTICACTPQQDMH
jgi:hypothetical protein